MLNKATAVTHTATARRPFQQLCDIRRLAVHFHSIVTMMGFCACASAPQVCPQSPSTNLVNSLATRSIAAGFNLLRQLKIIGSLPSASLIDWGGLVLPCGQVLHHYFRYMWHTLPLQISQQSEREEGTKEERKISKGKVGGTKRKHDRNLEIKGKRQVKRKTEERNRSTKRKLENGRDKEREEKEKQRGKI